MGFAINRTTWNEIVKCANVFCTYNDYNWDFTFRYVSQQCLPNFIATMIIRRPRVFHIGEWFVLPLFDIEIIQLNKVFKFNFEFQWHARKKRRL